MAVVLHAAAAAAAAAGVAVVVVPMGHGNYDIMWLMALRLTTG